MMEWAVHADGGDRSMFRRRTVLVVGARASQEVDRCGGQVRDRFALKIQFEHLYRRISGDDQGL